MSSPIDVACGFLPAFFEQFATNPAELADMYSPQSSVVVVDFDYGMSEETGAAAVKAVEQCAQIVQDCQLSVDSFTAAPIHGGVSVYASVTAAGKAVQHYFQFVTYLEACSAVAYGAESYFIRHQILIRTGTIAVEPPVEEAAAPTEETAVPTEAAAAQTEETAVPTEEVPAQTEETPAEPLPTPQPKAPQVEKRKTWASLASAAPSKAEPRAPVKVVAAQNGAKADAADAAPIAKAPEGKEAPAKPHAKAPRQPLPPIGDRLMFNIDHAVTEEEIRAALGAFAAHIVSLRNNSTNGHVFLDFAANEKVMDALKTNPPVVGARKTRVNVYRQKSRE